MIFNRVGPNYNRYIGIFNLIKCGSHSTRSHIFHQRSYTRGVAQSSAVIDVIVAKALTDQLLK